MSDNYSKNIDLSILLDDLREKYLPDSGKADTVGGEIIRALDRLLYRFYKCGDTVGEGYGIETCNSSYRYLVAHVPECPDLPDYHGEEVYENFLTELLEATVDYLKNNSRVFEKENTEDSREVSREDEQYIRDWEREDDEIDDSWYDEEEDDEEYI